MTLYILKPALSTQSNLLISSNEWNELHFSFQVRNPSDMIFAEESLTIVIEERQVLVSVVSPEFQLLEVEENATFVIKLLNSNGEELEAVGYKVQYIFINFVL